MSIYNYQKLFCNFTSCMRNIIIKILIFLPFLSFAQNDTGISSDEDLLQSNNYKQYHNSILKNITTNFNTGVSVFGYNQSSAFNTYFSPSVSTPISKKINLIAGVSVNNVTFNNYTQYPIYGNEFNNKISGNLTSMDFFASMQYKFSDKLTVNATVVKSKIIRNNIKNKNSTNISNFENNYYSIGLNYKISKTASFNFQMDFNRPYRPYNSPYNNSFMPMSNFGTNNMFYTY